MRRYTCLRDVLRVGRYLYDMSYVYVRMYKIFVVRMDICIRYVLRVGRPVYDTCCEYVNTCSICVVRR